MKTIPNSRTGGLAEAEIAGDNEKVPTLTGS